MTTATLEIFLKYGDPKRLRTAELSNWHGKAIAGPRNEFDKILDRPESHSLGIYFLTGTEPESDRKVIYIGIAECIRDRVKIHLKKDYWNMITFFVTKDDKLTKSDFRYIEGRLIELAKSTGRVEVKNNQGSKSKLSESAIEAMEVFLSKMLLILPILGVEAFVPTFSEDSVQTKQELLICKIKDVLASAILTPNGIVVLAGSEAVLKETKAACKYPNVLNRRNALIEEGLLFEQGSKFVFDKDTEFPSPSAAAAVIYGGSANGLTAWRNQAGKTLKELENV